jgi:hypothetical protein
LEGAYPNSGFSSVEYGDSLSSWSGSSELFTNEIALLTTHPDHLRESKLWDIYVDFLQTMKE